MINVCHQISKVILEDVSSKLVNLNQILKSLMCCAAIIKALHLRYAVTTENESKR